MSNPSNPASEVQKEMCLLFSGAAVGAIVLLCLLLGRLVPSFCRMFDDLGQPFPATLAWLASLSLFSWLEIALSGCVAILVKSTFIRGCLRLWVDGSIIVSCGHCFLAVMTALYLPLQAVMKNIK
jgi:type II secretory pathway component PulF